MFLWDWLTSWFEYFGFRNKKARLLFIGLDDAGKTTLLGRLKTGRMISAAPTHLPNSETLNLNGIQCTTFDLGGHAQARRVWKDYFPAIDAIVFVVDSANQNKISTAARELNLVLTDEDLSLCPVLIFGNKIDKPGALSHEHLSSQLNISHLLSGKDYANSNTLKEEIRERPVELFMCSILMTTGYGEGFRWLAKQI